MTKDIKLIRLLSGEDLLTEVVSDTGFKVTIKNPLRVVIIPGKSTPNSPTVGLAPWAEFSEDDEFVLDNQHIIAIMRPVKEFVSQYNSAFSGIITPSSSLLVPKEM